MCVNKKLVVVITAVIVIAAFFVYSYFQNSLSNNFYYKIYSLHKPVSIAYLLNAYNATSKPVQAVPAYTNYNGSLALSLKVGGLTTMVRYPFTANLMSNGTNYQRVNAALNITSGSSYGSSVQTSTGVDFETIRNGSRMYICSVLFGGGSLYSYSYGNVGGCISNSTLQILRNASSSSQSSSVLVSGAAKAVNVIFNKTMLNISSVSLSSYKGASCVLVNGEVYGSMPLRSLLNLSTSYYTGLLQQNITISGGFSSCFAVTGGNTALITNVSLSASLNSTYKVQFDLRLNQASSGTGVNNSQITTLPYRILNLSQVLAGRCSADYQTGNVTAYCTTPLLMNTTGALEANVSLSTSTYNFTTRSYSRAVPVRVLGLACVPYTYNPLDFVQQQAPPPADAYTPVNVTLQSYDPYNFTLSNYKELYFQCPIRQGKLGMSYNASLWALYRLNYTDQTMEIGTAYAYVTTSTPLGKNPT